MTDNPSSSILFNNGDELVIDLFCTDEDVIVDITGLTITAEVWAGRTKVFDLAVGDGITILFVNPNTAEDVEDQQAQFSIDLTEDQVAQLPFGRLTWIKVIFVDGDGLTTSSEAIWLDKVLP